MLAATCRTAPVPESMRERESSHNFFGFFVFSAFSFFRRLAAARPRARGATAGAHRCQRCRSRAHRLSRRSPERRARGGGGQLYVEAEATSSEPLDRFESACAAYRAGGGRRRGKAGGVSGLPTREHRTHRAVGRWIKEHSQPTSRVAALRSSVGMASPPHSLPMARRTGARVLSSVWSLLADIVVLWRTWRQHTHW